MESTNSVVRCRRCSAVVVGNEVHSDYPLCNLCKGPAIRYHYNRDALYNVRFTQLQKHGFLLLKVGGEAVSVS